MLTINDYQKEAHTTASYPVGRIAGHDINYIYPVMGLTEEAGEVSGKFAKAVCDFHGVITDERKTEIVKELGDVMWFIAEICTCLDVTLEEVAEKNLAKLASRKERGVIHGSGDNR